MSVQSAFFLFVIGLIGVMASVAELLTARRHGGVQRYADHIKQELENRANRSELVCLPWPSLVLNTRTVRLVLVALAIGIVAASVVSLSTDGWTYADIMVVGIQVVVCIMVVICATDSAPKWLQHWWRTNWKSFSKWQLVVLDYPQALLALWVLELAIAGMAIIIAIVALAGAI